MRVGRLAIFKAEFRAREVLFAVGAGMPYMLEDDGRQNLAEPSIASNSATRHGVDVSYVACSLVPASMWCRHRGVHVWVGVRGRVRTDARGLQQARGYRAYACRIPRHDG